MSDIIEIVALNTFIALFGSCTMSDIILEIMHETGYLQFLASLYVLVLMICGNIIFYALKTK